METLQSGLMAGAVTSDFYELSHTSEAYTSGSRTVESSKSAKRLSSGTPLVAGKGTIDEYLRPDYGRNKGHGFVSSVIVGNRDRSRRRDVAGDESESVQDLTRDGITQTIEYEVRYGHRTRSKASRSENSAHH